MKKQRLQFKLLALIMFGLFLLLAVSVQTIGGKDD